MGGLISLMLLLGKFAMSAGLNPINYTFWQTLMAGLILLIWRVPHASNIILYFKRRGFSVHVARYAIISGLTGVALPNIIAFMLVTKLGIGNTNLMYALPPVFTLLLSALVKQDTITCRKLLGILCVCLGSIGLLLAQGALAFEGNNTSIYWYAMGLLIPLSLGAGNVYRTIDWPTPLDALTLASIMLLGAAVCIGVYACVFNVELSVVLYSSKPMPSVMYLLVQIPLTALTYIVFFHLQRLTSPVYISQIGAVSAVIGCMLGVVFFDEYYSITTALAIMVVLMGVFVMSKKKA